MDLEAVQWRGLANVVGFVVKDCCKSDRQQESQRSHTRVNFRKNDDLITKMTPVVSLNRLMRSLFTIPKDSVLQERIVFPGSWEKKKINKMDLMPLDCCSRSG